MEIIYINWRDRTHGIYILGDKIFKLDILDSWNLYIHGDNTYKLEISDSWNIYTCR